MVIYIYMGISVDSLFDSVEPAVTPGRRGKGVAPQNPVTISGFLMVCFRVYLGLT